MTQEATIDLNEVLERVQNDKDLLVELFDIFLADCPAKITALKEAAAQKDLTRIKEVAHSMKGASGNISAKKLYALFLKIEQMAKTNDLSAMGSSLQELDRQMEEFKVCSSKLKSDFKKT